MKNDVMHTVIYAALCMLPSLDCKIAHRSSQVGSISIYLNPPTCVLTQYKCYAAVTNYVHLGLGTRLMLACVDLTRDHDL